MPAAVAVGWAQKLINKRHKYNPNKSDDKFPDIMVRSVANILNKQRNSC